MSMTLDMIPLPLKTPQTPLTPGMTCRASSCSLHPCPLLSSLPSLPFLSSRPAPPQVREPNLKYLALENMARLAEVPAVVDTGG